MRDFSKIKRIIIKIGSSSLVNEDLSINEDRIDTIMKSFKNLKDKGIDVGLVTSGAIAVGRHELHLKTKPTMLAVKQACAAVGQAKLMEYYNSYATKYNLICGQILLNHDDFQIRKRMMHLSDTLDEMFKNDIIPIINENDALAVEEIKVGDNDTLSALIVPMIGADLLILFSDIDGLYNKNPKMYDDAKLISTVDKIDKEIYDMVGINPSEVGTGGMETKLNAAIISTNANCNMIICNADRIDDISKIAEGTEIGTLFTAKEKGISSREHWLIFKAHSAGFIVVDKGLKNVLAKKKVSILPKGIIGVGGTFLQGSVISIIDTDNNIVAKGIVECSSSEIDKIKGLDSKVAKMVLNKDINDWVIHADNLVVMREDLLC